MDELPVEQPSSSPPPSPPPFPSAVAAASPPLLLSYAGAFLYHGINNNHFC